MIRPAAVYNKCRFARDFASLGRQLAVLCGNVHIRREDLTDAELSGVEEMENENDAMNAAMEKAAKRKAEYRDSKREMSPNVPGTKRDSDVSPNVPGTKRDSEMSHGQNGCPALSLPNKQTNKQTNKLTNNRSVPLTRTCVREETSERNGTERNGILNGTEEERLKDARERAERFAAVAKNDVNAFFDREHDAVAIICAVTGDFRSLRRWEQLAANKRDVDVREETFAFWREIQTGEEVKNRGAALNKRLSALSDK